MSNSLITIELLNDICVDVIYSFKKGKNGNGVDFEGEPNDIDIDCVCITGGKELDCNTLEQLGLMDDILRKINEAGEKESDILDLEAKGFI